MGSTLGENGIQASRHTRDRHSTTKTIKWNEVFSTTGETEGTFWIGKTLLGRRMKQGTNQTSEKSRTHSSREIVVGKTLGPKKRLLKKQGERWW